MTDFHSWLLLGLPYEKVDISIIHSGNLCRRNFGVASLLDTSVHVRENTLCPELLEYLLYSRIWIILKLILHKFVSLFYYFLFSNAFVPFSFLNYWGRIWFSATFSLIRKTKCKLSTVQQRMLLQIFINYFVELFNEIS